MTRWTGYILIAVILTAAISGWSGTGGDDAAGSVIEDMKTLERLAGGIVSEERRLWVVTLKGEGVAHRWSGERMDDAVRWVEKQAKTGEWNGYVNVQGALDAGAQLTHVWSRIETAGRARQVDSYKDAGTFSTTYFSEDVKGRLAAGDSAINLQAAAHFDTESQSWRVTLGTPAILIEY